MMSKPVQFVHDYFIEGSCIYRQFQSIVIVSVPRAGPEEIKLSSLAAWEWIINQTSYDHRSGRRQTTHKYVSILKPDLPLK